jgi:hypothetical protein
MAPAQAITDFGALLQTLVDAGVDFILVGGLAASAHGSARFTTDLDVVYSRSPANLKKLVDCLASLQFRSPGGVFRARVKAVEFARAAAGGEVHGLVIEGATPDQIPAGATIEPLDEQ